MPHCHAAPVPLLARTQLLPPVRGGLLVGVVRMQIKDSPGPPRQILPIHFKAALPGVDPLLPDIVTMEVMLAAEIQGGVVGRRQQIDKLRLYHRLLRRILHFLTGIEG